MAMKKINSIKEADMSGLRMPAVVIFEHPEDFPESYIARIFDCDKPTDTYMESDTIEPLMEDLKQNTELIFVERGKEDVKALVGVFM